MKPDFSSFRRILGLFLLVATGLLAACNESDQPDDKLSAVRAPAIAKITPADKALTDAFIPEIDPATMNSAEIEKALGTGPHCHFRYVSEGKPVLAITKSKNGSGFTGVAKLNGNLVILDGRANENSLYLSANRIQMTLSPDRTLEATGEKNKQESGLVFRIGEELEVGYRGYYFCPSDQEG